MQIHTCFTSLSLVFSSEIHRTDIDLGTVSITDIESGRNWLLDISASLRDYETNTITCQFDTLENTKEDACGSGNKEDFTLLLSDLDNPLFVEFFCETETAQVPMKATLNITKVNGELLEVQAHPECPIMDYAITLSGKYNDCVARNLFKNRLVPEIEERIKFLSDNEGCGEDVYRECLEKCTPLEFACFVDDHLESDFVKDKLNTYLHIQSLIDSMNLNIFSPYHATYSYDETSQEGAEESALKYQKFPCLSVDISDTSYATDEDEENKKDGWVVVDISINVSEMVKYTIPLITKVFDVFK